MSAENHILIAEDDHDVADMLKSLLEEAGYRVTATYDGVEFVEKAQVLRPDMVIIDVRMPRMDGYEAIRQLRHDTRLAHIPIIILTASKTPMDVVTGFESGADDYLTKPFDPAELLVRVASRMKYMHRFAMNNPLTGLPGNRLIEQSIRYYLDSKRSFTLLYIDIDNFKVLNDTYGFARGDQVIRLLARLLEECYTELSDQTYFIGHIGGDDFVALIDLEYKELWCRNLIEQFALQIKAFYDQVDVERGYVINRNHITMMLPEQFISIAGICIYTDKVWLYDELIEQLATIKQQAKHVPGNSYVLHCEDHDVLVYQSPQTQAKVALLNDIHQRWFPVLQKLAYRQQWTILEYLEEDLAAVFVVGALDSVLQRQLDTFSSPMIVRLPSTIATEDIRLRFDVHVTQFKDLETYLFFAFHLQRLEGR